jgi:exodeoxyribonuclease-3
MDHFMQHLRKLAGDGREYIVCGDWNICHKEIDIKNWKGNQKNSGFLPEERAWLDELFDDVGYVDAFRLVNQEADQYSWWSNRGQARANNVGWRLDYHVVSPQTASKTTAASIYRDESFSDHAPVIIDYAL